MTGPSRPVRLGVLGDLHAHFDDSDVAALDARGLDLVCFVGDLGTLLHRDTLDVARTIARLRTPAVVIPGNHDATHPLAVLFEGTGTWQRRPGSGRRALKRAEALRRALGPVGLAGYTLHPVRSGVTVVAARPHAMDGRWLTFGGALRARFGVRSLEDSAARLRSLVDAAQGDLVFLAHLGPRGLGGGPRDPYTFSGRRDHGDPDLAAALAHARARGRRVAAVLSGHLHHVGTDRDWRVVRDGTLHVNAARVPRVFDHGGRRVRHHVEVTVSDGEATAEEVLLPG